MDGKSIGIVLRENHLKFIRYISSLTHQDFEKKMAEKWTVGQHLDHIVKSVAPLASILPKKEYIQGQFGTSGRTSISYEALVLDYRIKLMEGGKASGAFIPEDIPWEERDTALIHLNRLVGQVLTSLGDYREKELDRMYLPHPLMGMLTVREMLYFTQYHVMHHLEQVKKM